MIDFEPRGTTADFSSASTRPGPEARAVAAAAAPDFDLPGVDGRRYSLADFEDAKVLVVSDAIEALLAGREVAIFAWDTTVDSTINARIVDDGGAVENVLMMRQTQPALAGPSMLIGSDQRLSVGEIAFRGVATAFGAGTVAPIALIYFAHAELGGISSLGLPIPSW